MAYFKNANTLEELRKQYKELLKIHYPDNGRNMSDMQKINAEFDSTEDIKLREMLKI